MEKHHKIAYLMIASGIIQASSMGAFIPITFDGVNYFGSYVPSENSQQILKETFIKEQTSLQNTMQNALRQYNNVNSKFDVQSKTDLKNLPVVSKHVTIQAPILAKYGMPDMPVVKPTPVAPILAKYGLPNTPVVKPTPVEPILARYGLPNASGL